MRRLRYQVAASLDGYIAGPNGEYDWIPMDPEIDFAALHAQFDVAVMGRKTYVVTRASGYEMPGLKIVVFSRTLRQEDCPDAIVVRDDPAGYVRTLKREPGKDIWLFGGGEVFRTLLEADLVDTVEPAVIPVLLGGGIPLLPRTERRTTLSLTRHQLYEKSGTMLLEYDVVRSAAQ